MGQFTPYIGLYIPVAGETNYDDSFASGMINLDQHDHSGGPNKGVPITSSGLADFSVTYNKLAANVADITTGIGVNSTPGLQNQLQILGILRNIYTLSLVPTTGFISMNGSTVAGRTFTDSASISWTNGNGASGNPSASLIAPVTVPNGGTGRTSFTANAIVAGGATGTGALQQVSGLGTAGQVLTSSGSGLPTWQNNFVQPTRPCFSAYVGANQIDVTGDGTAYRMDFTNVFYDQSSSFVTGNIGTSGFTAPLTGIYFFNMYLVLKIKSSSIKQMELDLYVNNTYSRSRTPIYVDPNDIIDSSGFINITGGQMLNLTAGDLIYPVLTCTGSGSLNVDANLYTGFQGYLIC